MVAGEPSTQPILFASKELQDDYFRQQRQLLAYKYELKTEAQQKACDYLLMGAKRLIDEVKAELMDGIRELIKEKREMN